MYLWIDLNTFFFFVRNSVHPLCETLFTFQRCLHSFSRTCTNAWQVISGKLVGEKKLVVVVDTRTEWQLLPSRLKCWHDAYGALLPLELCELWRRGKNCHSVLVSTTTTSFLLYLHLLDYSIWQQYMYLGCKCICI